MGSTSELAGINARIAEADARVRRAERLALAAAGDEATRWEVVGRLLGDVEGKEGMGMEEEANADSDEFRAALADVDGVCARAAELAKAAANGNDKWRSNSIAVAEAMENVLQADVALERVVGAMDARDGEIESKRKE
jgi:hypothetical protein